jgi:hypothetical protein
MRSAAALVSCLLLLAAPLPAPAQALLVPMDSSQTDHLRAYGLTYWCLQEPRLYECEWLLNYRCGAFVLPDRPDVRARAGEMAVSLCSVTAAELTKIHGQVQQANMERIVLTKAPKVGVYVPPDAEPWDDAVRLALGYAQIKYDKLWDAEVIQGKLKDYEWLHLHHEDFTGQFGKFFATHQNEPWYRRTVLSSRRAAKELGFGSVAAMKGAVALGIAQWVHEGGFLFAMCTATDTLDIALAAQGLDIVPREIDGTPIAANADAALNFAPTLAFRNFRLVYSAFDPEFSTIDVQPPGNAMQASGEKFTLFEFSAKQDPIAYMLTQCQVMALPDFLGQTSAFRRSCLKSTVTVLGDFPGQDKVKYIHGDYGKGTFTFFGGHDPEDYAHLVGEPATDLAVHKHSPSYRLILNNILFPAAKTKEQKT